MASEMAIRRTKPSSYSIAEARDALAALVHEAERGRAVHLTRRGKPVAAIVSVRDLERLRGGHASFWDTLVAFREEADLGELWTGGDPFEGVRDRSAGRRVRL